MIEKLEYLIALAGERHFGRAAEACGVSQPTLSFGVKQLEAALGTQLVERGSRFIRLTPEGEQTLEWARRIVSDARAMRQEIKTLKHGLKGTLRIAAIPPAVSMTAELTTALRERHPDVRFVVSARTSSEILGPIDNLEIDGGITYIDKSLPARFTVVPLYEEHYQLVIGRDSPFARRKSVTWAEVAGIPLCLMTPDTQNRQIIDRLLKAHGGTVEPTLESNSMTALAAHVRTGRWASVMAEKLVQSMELTGKISAIPIVEPTTTSLIGLVVPRREPMTRLTAALVGEARRWAKHVS